MNMTKEQEEQITEDIEAIPAESYAILHPDSAEAEREEGGE